VLTGLISILGACGSNPEKEMNRAEANLTNEKAKQYQDKLDTCERLLKAVELCCEIGQ